MASILPHTPSGATISKEYTGIKDRDIVVIGLQPWYYEIGSNCKNIATHLSQYNRVLYVNLPVNRKTYYLTREKGPGLQHHCDIIKNNSNTIEKINEKMWEFYPTSLVESINWLPTTTAFKAVNYLNNRRFANDIKKAMKQLQFKDIILFNDNDMFNGFYLKELLSPSVYIYYQRDFLQGYDYWQKHGSVLEPELIRKADIVITNTSYFSDYCSRFNPRSYDIGQGCNIETFNHNIPRSIPAPIRHITSPIIGYVGAIIASRLDKKIISLIAAAHAEWNVVLVGPEDDTFKRSRLHKLKNVHFTGRKSLDQLPDYIHAFDVCINPQLINNITIGNYPLKIDEYLAMGKPVVATRTAAMKLFEAYTYLADQPEDYISLIEKALAENSPEKQQQRIDFANSHTWDNSMNALGKIVNAYIEEHQL